MLRVAATVTLLLAACSSSSPACRVDADCASLRCDPVAFVCLPAADSGSSSPMDAGSTKPDAGGSEMPPADAGMTDAGAVDAGSVSGMCVPNNDGVIQSSEVPLQAGLHATFRVALDAGVDTAGTTTDGGTSWDFSKMLSGDQDVVDNLQPISGQWFADSFPTATYAAQMSQRADLLGVFQVTSSALLLQGIVSPQSGLTQTELTYNPPVIVLQFPLQVGAHWQTVSSVSGRAEGVVAAYAETYTMQVDASGTVITPYAPFAALRVSTLLEQPAGQTREFTFVTECFGPVVSITSQLDEPLPEFTNAAEFQRLAP